MPLNFTYNLHKNKGILGGLGIVLSYGIGGKSNETINNTDSVVNYNSSIIFDGKETYNSDGNVHYKAFEISGNLFLGYKFSSHYILKAEFNQGLTNLFVNGEYYTNGSFKTSYFALNFCYGL